MRKDSNLQVLTKGILKENPVLVLILGTCPTLAVSTAVSNALGMGAAATFVLICSNIVISALRKIIPDTVRIPCYIVIIAGFVTIVEMIVHAYFPALYDMLGVYLALITVNCIILGRAEMFARENGIFRSALDGIGMGLGFTLTLTVMGAIREFLGSGAVFGFAIPGMDKFALSVMTSAPGGFLIFGVLMAAAVKLELANPSKLGDGNGCAGGCLGCPYACGKEEGGNA